MAVEEISDGAEGNILGGVLVIAGKRYWMSAPAVAGAYLLAGILSLRATGEGGLITPILPQAGIALASLLLLGYRVWPGVAAGAFLTYLIVLPDTGGPSPVTLGLALLIGSGLTLEAVAGAFMYRRYVGQGDPLLSVRRFIKFFALVALPCTIIGASIGTAGLMLEGLAPAGGFGRVWLGWWLGGEASVLLIVPLLLSWIDKSTLSWRPRKLAEFFSAIAVVMVILQAILIGATGAAPIPAWAGLLIPFFIASLIWLSLRYGRRGVTAALTASWVLAIANTLNGVGSLVQETELDSMLYLQATWTTLVIVVLIPAAAIVEGRIGHMNLRLVKDELEDRARALVLANTKLETELGERRRAEQELSAALHEVNHSNAVLQQFAYVVSHDLQEPLRMMTTFGNLFQKRYGGSVDKEGEEIIAFVTDGAARMQEMINDLLDYSRASTREGSFGPTETETVLRNAMSNMSTQIRESGAEISFERLPALTADSSQLAHLFQNLIGNAIKFRSDEPPRIHVAARRERHSWIFSMSDNGIGIRREDYKRIFEIFERLHHREDYPGTGIGLAICKKIVERHGGRIWVESVPGQGSIFYFTIPAAERYRLPEQKPIESATPHAK